MTKKNTRSILKSARKNYDVYLLQVNTVIDEPDAWNKDVGVEEVNKLKNDAKLAMKKNWKEVDNVVTRRKCSSVVSRFYDNYGKLVPLNQKCEDDLD